MNLDIYIISLNAINEHSVKTVFDNVKIYTAVDRRGATEDDVQEIVSEDAYLTLKRGRKWHHELSSPGAVGLYESVRNILNMGDNPVLIFEEDVICKPDLKPEVEKLLELQNEFDLVVFGPVNQPEMRIDFTFTTYCKIKSEFWGLHATLYSSVGRKRIRDCLKDKIEMQLDSKLSRLALFHDLRVMVQCDERTLAYQEQHLSNIQENIGCALCDMPTSNTSNNNSSSNGIILLSIGITVILFIVLSTKPDFLRILVMYVCSFIFILNLKDRSQWCEVCFVCNKYQSDQTDNVSSYCRLHSYNLNVWIIDEKSSFSGEYLFHEAALNLMKTSNSKYILCISPDHFIWNMTVAIEEYIPSSECLLVTSPGPILYKVCDESIDKLGNMLHNTYNGGTDDVSKFFLSNEMHTRDIDFVQIRT